VLHQQTTVSEAILDGAGSVVGVNPTTGAGKQPVTYRVPVVLSGDGVSGKLAQHVGRHRNERRPPVVAGRHYYTSPRTHDDYLESWFELWDGQPTIDDANLLPGYGWIFGMGDATVNVGLGVLTASGAFQKTDYRALLTRWLDATPEEWGLREVNATCPTRGRAANGLQPGPALQPRERPVGDVRAGRDDSVHRYCVHRHCVCRVRRRLALRRVGLGLMGSRRMACGRGGRV
jgi:flavin-dependent dehydrogenase